MNRIRRNPPAVNWLGWTLTGLVFVGAPGCGGGEPGPPRIPVSGHVTLGGQPLPAGSITFLPAADGPAAGGTISDGSFALGRSEGLAPGSYKVEIVSVQPTGKQVTSPDDSTATIEEVKNVVPSQYNVRSTLRVDVKPEGENSYHFVLAAEEEPRTSKTRRVAGRSGRSRGRASSTYFD